MFIRRTTKSLKALMPALCLGLTAMLPMACNKEQPAATAPATGAKSTETAQAPAPSAPAKDEKAASPSMSAAPSLPGAKAAKVVLPAAMEADDPNILAYVRIAEPNKSLDRIAAWTSLFQPGMDAATLRQQLTNMQIDLSQLRAGANVTVVAFKSSDPASPPSWAALIPTKADSPLGKQIAMMAGSSAQAAVGDDLLLAKDAATLQTAQAASAKMTSFNNYPLTSDLQVYMNAASLMDIYGVMLRNQISMLQAMMSMGAGQDPAMAKQMANTQKMLGIEANAVLDLLAQSKSVTENIKLDPDAIENSGVFIAKDGTELSKYLSQDPASGTDLARYGAGGHTMEMSASVSDVKPLMDAYMKYASQILPADQPDLTKKLQEMVDEISKRKSFDLFFAMDLKPGSPISGESIYRIDDPEALLKMMRDNMQTMMQGVGAASGNGMQYDTTVKEKVRTVAGQPVDQITMKVTLPADMPPVSVQMLKAMWGDGAITTEITTQNGLVLSSINHPVDALAGRVASGPATGQMDAQKAFEAGSVAMADIRPISYLMAIYSALSPQAAASASVPDAPPLSAALYLQQGAAYGRSRVPKDLVLAMKKVFSDMASSPAMLPGGAPMGVPGGMSQDQAPGMPPRPGSTSPSSPSTIEIQPPAAK